MSSQSADQLQIIAEFELTSIAGTPATVTLASRPSSARLHATCTARGKRGTITRAEPVPADAVADIFVQLRSAGATHYATVEAIGTLALDAANAELLNTALDDASPRARALHKAYKDEIRATRDVRRVLCWTPGWSEHELTEAYPAPDAHKFAAWARQLVRYSLPPRIKLDNRCPSLAAVKQRSASWGFFPGGGDSRLYLVSDADWDLLVAETAQCRAADAARKAAADAASAAEHARLQTVEVPADAIEAFRRYRGDAEAAWEAEDEQAAGAIRRFGAAIEAQGIAYAPVRFASELLPPGA